MNLIQSSWDQDEFKEKWSEFSNWQPIDWTTKEFGIVNPQKFIQYLSVPKVHTFIELTPKKKWIEAAIGRYNSIDRTQREFFNNSFKLGAGELPSYVFEEAMAELLNGVVTILKPAIFKSDIRTKDKIYEAKIKRCADDIISYYQASVPEVSCEQDGEYIFGRTRYKSKEYDLWKGNDVRLATEITKLYVCGSITQKDFWDIALYRVKGQRDPFSHVKWNERETCYKLPYFMLNNPTKLPFSPRPEDVFDENGNLK
jgi:hypothetical protein